MADELNVSDRWRLWRRRVDLREYNTRWDRLEAEGHRVHDEASFVEALGGERILDAGCGNGRVAVELSRRGKHVVGIDNDADMLDLAKAKDASVIWMLADLAGVRLDERFDVIVMAGDVLHYVTPGFESVVVSNLSRHLEPNGRLVSGASMAEPAWLDHYDHWCRAGGLELESRYASWDGLSFEPDQPGHYSVSVHRRSGAAGR